MTDILRENLVSSNPAAVKFTPEWAFGGTHRTMPLATFTDEHEPERGSYVALQGIHFTPDAERLVHLYVNEGLAMTLTPAEARTLAAMLNLSAGELDGQGPDFGPVAARSPLRVA